MRHPSAAGTAILWIALSRRWPPRGGRPRDAGARARSVWVGDGRRRSHSTATSATSACLRSAPPRRPARPFDFGVPRDGAHERRWPPDCRTRVRRAAHDVARAVPGVLRRRSVIRGSRRGRTVSRAPGRSGPPWGELSASSGLPAGQGRAPVRDLQGKVRCVHRRGVAGIGLALAERFASECMKVLMALTIESGPLSRRAATRCGRRLPATLELAVGSSPSRDVERLAPDLRRLTAATQTCSATTRGWR